MACLSVGYRYTASGMPKCRGIGTQLVACLSVGYRYTASGMPKCRV